MTSLLFGRVLLIIAGMIGITTITSRYNKSFETQSEYWITLIATFAVLFAIGFVANSFPMNIIMVGIFSGLIGRSIGPAILYYGSGREETERNNILFQAFLGTTIALVVTSLTVFMTGIDFSFMGLFLSIALLILIVLGLLNQFWFKSSMMELVRPYIGVVIFVGYMLYDFDKLEKLASDPSWASAIHVSVSIYLDIVNMFMYLLEILSRGGNHR